MTTFLKSKFCRYSTQLFKIEYELGFILIRIFENCATLACLAVKVDLEASHRGSVGSQANRSGEAGKREKKVE